MNKEEIKQFKSLLKQGILRHTNILLDYKFQSALLKIIENYEKLYIAKDKTTNYYLKTLAKNKSMPDEAVEMFNLLEGNKQ